MSRLSLGNPLTMAPVGSQGSTASGEGQGTQSVTLY